MRFVDFAMALGVFLIFFAFIISYAARHVTNLKESVSSSEIKTFAYDYFKKLFSSKGTPENWDTSRNPSELGLTLDLYRIPVLLTENTSLNRSNEPLDLHINFDLNCTKKTWNSTVRVYDQDTELISQIYNQTYCSSQFLQEANVLFQINLSANQNKTILIYYSNDSQVSDVNYSTDLNLSQYILQNSKERVDLQNRNETRLYTIGTTTADWTVNDDRWIVGYRNSSTWIDFCKSSNEGGSGSIGNYSVTTNGPLKKTVRFDVCGVIEIDFSLHAYNSFEEIKFYSLGNTANPAKAWIWQREPGANATLGTNNCIRCYSTPSANCTEYCTAANLTEPEANYTKVNGWLMAAIYDTTAQQGQSIVAKSADTWDNLSTSVTQEWPRATAQIVENTNTTYYHYFYNSTSSDKLTDAITFLNKTANPILTSIYPEEKITAVSASKLKAMREMSYDDAVNVLGKADFKVEISEK